MQKSLLRTISLLAFLLGACTNVQKSGDIPVVTPASPIVSTSTSTQKVVSLQPTLTQIPETATPTASSIPTGTVIPYPDATPLAQLLLSSNDILAPDAQKKDFVLGIVDSFLKEDPAYVKDKSYELKESCQIECTKQIWGTSYRYVEIQMFRVGDEQQAGAKAEELFYSLKPYRLEYATDEYRLWIDAPTSNTHIGISDWNNGFVLTTSRGNIALMIVSYPSPYSDDALHEVSLMAAFANLQLEKLKKANLIP